jgi:hypothetical protein
MLYGRYNAVMIKTELTVHKNYDRQPALKVREALIPCINLSGTCPDIYDGIYDDVSSFFINLRIMNQFSQ